MREYKFRAWDVINKKMYPVAFPTWNGITEGKIDFVNHSVEIIDEDGDDNPILMQFTGFRDKNGKEIYEGDIVDINGGTFATLDYVDAAYELISLDGKFISHLCMVAEIKEVIGNIYENPELLSKSK